MSGLPTIDSGHRRFCRIRVTLFRNKERGSAYHVHVRPDLNGPSSSKRFPSTSALRAVLTSFTMIPLCTTLCMVLATTAARRQHSRRSAEAKST